jgi:hypothetical protein
MGTGVENAAVVDEPQGVERDILQEALVFLDDLRESGRTNMFGACPYLEDMFGPEFMNRRQAKDVLSYWMKTFEKRHPSGETEDS